MTLSAYASTIATSRYCHPGETWADVARRVASNVLGAIGSPQTTVDRVASLIAERKLLPGGRYLAASGRDLHQVQNCLLLRPRDTREGWAEHLAQACQALMTGAGIGGEYSALRPEGTPLRRSGGFASGPLPLIHATNEVGRAAKSGGHRRAAIWAGLSWAHPDVLGLVRAKEWDPHTVARKLEDFSYPAPLDHTNISVCLDDAFFAAYGDPAHLMHETAHRVYWMAVESALRSGEPGFAVNVGENEGEDLRNACTEVTSRDDSDICNLASINLARVESLEEMREIVELGTLFLVAGTVYSDVPYPKVAEVRERNRRLGLGLMGVAEWLLVRGHRYAPCSDLIPWLDAYAESTAIAHRHADRLGISRPVKTRAIAPTGTIGIVAETTTGIEPIFACAYLRRYLDSGVWRAQYVVDPTARRLVQQGIPASQIEDAYSLAEEVECRVAFQAWIQGWVDHGISSTINLPAWGSPSNTPEGVRDFGEMLLRYLPRLRGITVYPDGARGGQPLTPVSLDLALAHEGEVLTEAMDVCDLRGGSCGA